MEVALGARVFDMINSPQYEEKVRECLVEEQYGAQVHEASLLCVVKVLLVAVVEQVLQNGIKVLLCVERYLYEEELE